MASRCWLLILVPLVLGIAGVPVAFYVAIAIGLIQIAHFVFAAYILIAIYFEERNFIEDLGEDYTEYKRTVPGLVPFSKKKDTLIPEGLHEVG